MGALAEATIASHRCWIPRAMEVGYAAKATTDIACVATTDLADWARSGDIEVPVHVVATRGDGTAVVEGTIRLRRPASSFGAARRGFLTGQGPL